MTTTTTKKYCYCLSIVAVAAFVCLLEINRRQIVEFNVHRRYYQYFYQFVRSFLDKGNINNTYTDCPSIEINATNIQSISSPFRALQVQTCGPFLRRIEMFNAALDELRLNYSSRGNWEPLAPQEKIKLLRTVNDDFLSHLGNFSQMRMVMLPWETTAGYGQNWSSLKDAANLLVQNYYDWTVDDPLCTWIETPGTIKMKYDVIYNRTCHRDMNRGAEPRTLSTISFHAKPINIGYYWPNDGNALPAHLYTQQPPFAFYMYVIRDAIANDVSDVYSGNLKLMDYVCGGNYHTTPPSGVDQIPLHDEIFVIGQPWGRDKFHRMVEVMPRVSLYVDFLKRHPNIKILAPETGGRTAELITILGLNETRLISGTFRAKVLYLPRASGCGFANVQESQVLSLLYRNYITANLSPYPRNRLVLIRRSGSRAFTEQLKIEKALQDVAAAFNLTYAMFIDNPVPSLNETMRMFHSAVMVVAPHGAGLANLLFSQPGTYVVEGVCNLPHVNFCFQRLTYVLGHHWHGTPSRGGCEGVVDVAADSIERAALSYLRQYRASAQQNRVG